jgi:hypothetical protein
LMIACSERSKRYFQNMRMTKEQAEPYFRNFKQWLEAFYPEALFRLQFNEISFRDMEMLIVEWAADITRR